jgi:predicted amidophosphoribosyltransferase
MLVSGTQVHGFESRAIASLLTKHNTLRRHLHLTGLIDSTLCRKCGADDETSAHILCWCEALASLRHVYFGCSLLEPENIKNVTMGGRLELWQSDRAPINCDGAQRAR